MFLEEPGVDLRQGGAWDSIQSPLEEGIWVAGHRPNTWQTISFWWSMKCLLGLLAWGRMILHHLRTTHDLKISQNFDEVHLGAICHLLCQFLKT